MANDTRFVNGFLFFVSADVCEKSPGDCLTDFSETGKWLWNWDGMWIAESSGDLGPQYTDRQPTNPLTATSGDTLPFIAELAVPNGKCNKRIVWGDMPTSAGTVSDPQFRNQVRAWGAKQLYRIHEANSSVFAEMRLRFALFTSTSPPYTIAPVGTIAEIGTSSVVGSSDIPEGIRCKS